MPRYHGSRHRAGRKRRWGQRGSPPPGAAAEAPGENAGPGDPACCGVARGTWRRLLVVCWLCNIVAIALLASSLGSADNAGGAHGSVGAGAAGAAGSFCLADMRKDGPCENPRAGCRENLCVDQTTLQCVQAQTQGRTTLALLSSAVKDGRLRHIGREATSRLVYLAVAFLIAHTLALTALEFPVSLEAFSWRGTTIPERIFAESPWTVITSFALKFGACVCVAFALVAAVTFPAEAGCETLGSLPSQDSLGEGVSRASFEAACQQLRDKCNVRAVGVPDRWWEDNSVKAVGGGTSLQKIVSEAVGLAVSGGVLLVLATVIKWGVWVKAVADTCVDDGVGTGRRAVVQEQRQHEAFDAAIMRIQHQRRTARERRRRYTDGPRNIAMLIEKSGVVKQSSSKYAVEARTENGLLVDDVESAVEESEAGSQHPTSPTADDGRPVCIVCLDILQPQEEANLALACGHVFHAECIQQWFNEGGQGRRCPVCRHEHQDIV